MANSVLLVIAFALGYHVHRALSERRQAALFARLHAATDEAIQVHRGKAVLN